MGVSGYYLAIFFTGEIVQTILRPMENHGENYLDSFRCHPISATIFLVQFLHIHKQLASRCPDTMASHPFIDHSQGHGED